MSGMRCFSRSVGRSGSIVYFLGANISAAFLLSTKPTILKSTTQLKYSTYFWTEEVNVFKNNTLNFYKT